MYKEEAVSPKIDSTAYIAAGAIVVGDVEIGVSSSVWFNAVLRADNDSIRIGTNSNVQDGAVIHEDAGSPVVIGDNVTIGHMAMLHGCTIGDNSMVGMGAIVLNGCRIGRNCLVAAGALVTGGTIVPDNSLIMGAPAKIIKPMSEANLREVQAAAVQYTRHAKEYSEGKFGQAPADGIAH